MCCNKSSKGLNRGFEGAICLAEGYGANGGSRGGGRESSTTTGRAPGTRAAGANYGGRACAAVGRVLRLVHGFHELCALPLRPSLPSLTCAHA
jgi:hypothetical protein